MKRTRMIVSVLIIILSVWIMIFNACGTREAIALPLDIANRLLENINMPRGVLVSDENFEDTGQLAQNLMGADFNPDMFDGYAFYPPMVSVNAAEFGIFKVKNETDIEKAKQFAKHRIDSTVQSFEDYLPDQHKIAKNGEIRTEGKYVYYSMTKDNKRVFQIINEMLNDK